jgi:integrase/recombinase XerD
VGERALAWCQKYLDEVRPELVGVRDQAFFFLSKTGERLSPNGLTKLVRDYVSAADLGKTGACHLFRHAMATAMLENGADIRFIQEMLGHSKLSTTEIYTRVSIQKLQEIHRATHPSARLPDRPGTAGEASAALQEPDER